MVIVTITREELFVVVVNLIRLAGGEPRPLTPDEVIAMTSLPQCCAIGSKDVDWDRYGQGLIEL